MRKTTISIERIRELSQELYKVNDLNLEEIEFTENGTPVKIPQNIIDDYKYTGLNTVDFIMSEFYKHGFETKKNKK